MYNQCRVSASLLAVEDLRTQPEIICHKTKSMEKGFPVQNLNLSCPGLLAVVRLNFLTNENYESVVIISGGDKYNFIGKYII